MEIAEKTEVYFIPHCDDENCSLGFFYYDCPCCNKITNDYDIWHRMEDVQDGKPHSFLCENCQAQLTVEFDNKKHEYFISLTASASLRCDFLTK